MRHTVGMSLPRFVVDGAAAPPAEGALVRLGDEQARHLGVLRLKPGAALELLLPPGGAGGDWIPWRADLAELARHHALVRLVAPLAEAREAPRPLLAYLPLPAQLSLLDDLLPPLVELGATRLQPVVYARSEHDPRKTAARLERWRRIALAACEQSHRTRPPEFLEPLPFEGLLAVDAAQKWVAYELPTGAANPDLGPGSLAFTSGPEGGITHGEFAALQGAGWQAVSLGPAILRAVTAPVALLGAVQFLLRGKAWHPGAE